MAHLPVPSAASKATTKTSYEPREDKVVLLPVESVSVIVEVIWPNPITSVPTTSTPRKPCVPPPLLMSVHRTAPSLPGEVSMRLRKSTRPDKGVPAIASSVPSADTLKRSKLASCVVLAHWAMPSGLNLTTTAFVATSLPVLSGLLSLSGMTGTTTLSPKSKALSASVIVTPQNKDPSVIGSHSESGFANSLFHNSRPSTAASFVKKWTPPVPASAVTLHVARITGVRDNHVAVGVTVDVNVGVNLGTAGMNGVAEVVLVEAAEPSGRAFADAVGLRDVELHHELELLGEPRRVIGVLGGVPHRPVRQGEKLLEVSPDGNVGLVQHRHDAFNLDSVGDITMARQAVLDCRAFEGPQSSEFRVYSSLPTARL